MEDRVAFYEGCLLGLAAGDALGCAVEEKTLDQIHADYGPNGLMGYDLPGDLAEISSHTQTAAFAANGLLAALSRGRVENALDYITRALREWNRSRISRGVPEDNFCWLSRLPEFRRRNCTDTRILDALNREQLGTVDNPANRTNSPGGMMVSLAVGLFYDKRRMEAGRIGIISADAAALLCGAPEAFLAGAAVAYIIAAVLNAPEQSLEEHCLQAAAIIQGQFGKRFTQAAEVAAAITGAVRLAKQPQAMPGDILEGLNCVTAEDCLAGAVYTCLVHPGNFDAAMVTAVNHSGASAAVGAVTGAILGAKLGVEAIPDFYLEPLESGKYLRGLARDLEQGTPASGLFDDAWEQKYAHGTPVEH